MLSSTRPTHSVSLSAGSVLWWAAALRAGTVTIVTSECPLPARHSHHRYSILGPGGVQQLSIPITGDTRNAHTPMSAIAISEHAHWRRTHWGALYSAYGQTPYFDHIADDLQHLLLHDSLPQPARPARLLELNSRLQQLIVDFMQLPITFEYASTAPNGTAPLYTHGITTVPYHQLWSDRHGFTPHLSIIDLMMNEGPEGIFTLLKMAN